jgi:hypothetical protein
VARDGGREAGERRLRGLRRRGAPLCHHRERVHAPGERELLAGGGLRTRPAGQGTDTGRLEVDGPPQPRVVELAFDAAGRIGSARWLRPSAQTRPQEQRMRRPL